LGLLGGSEIKNPPANIGDTGSIPGLGRSPGEGNGNLLYYSCLGNPMVIYSLDTALFPTTQGLEVKHGIYSYLNRTCHSHRSQPPALAPVQQPLSNKVKS